MTEQIPGLTAWLMANGGPAIRWRTANELIGEQDAIDSGRLVSDMLASPMTQAWLERIKVPGESLSGFHHSRPEAFENAASKLCELGLRAGMTPLDTRMAPFRGWLEEQAEALAGTAAEHDVEVTPQEAQQELAHGHRWFEALVVAGRLAWMGYDDPAIGLCLSHRLETLYALAETGDHDIYIPQDTFGDYPNNPFRKRRFIDPRFNNVLPSIHDVYALAHYPPDILDVTARAHIDAVIAYILHPDYQALEEGYGVMRVGPRRYFSMGWSVHLPGYEGLEMDDAHARIFVQRLELMAHFAAARAHPWFQNALVHLESFRTPEGAYRFPARYLVESAAGYWVSGAYMRLEENRRARQALDLESTFRLLSIRKPRS